MDETEAALKHWECQIKPFIWSGLIRLARASPNVALIVQSDGQKVTVRFPDGRDRKSCLMPMMESILDAALRQGLICPMPAKCVCATCKCKVLRGKVAMETNYSLNRL